MTVEHMRKNHIRQVGNSYGLAMKEFSGEGVEQVLVFETNDKQRPIDIEFWEGYSIPNHAVLTRNQAIELAKLIIDWAIGGI